MANWIETKVRYDKTMSSGMTKRVTEAYLFDALSFTEAEARATEECSKYITGEFNVTSVRKAYYDEVIPSGRGDDKWYNVKIITSTIDERNGLEKRTPFRMLLSAKDFNDAVDTARREIQSWSITNCEIASISESSIVDVYAYKGE